jgi:eukaryotic-like serine/threonine-protein kinase
MDSAGQGHLLARRYRLGTVIGRGGMGVVWRARDELFDREVAVKEITWPPYFSDQEQQAACRRACSEARMAARINHANVIRVYDIVEDDGYPWIVMEFVPYRSLRDVVKEQGPLHPVQAARVGLGVLAALRAAHREGIVHRDVKPANILVGPDRVVLTDFGIACTPDDSPTLSTAGVLIGSPSFIAPERARGRQSAPSADLWGLGASLYAAVEGRPPFDRDNVVASITAVVHDELDPATNAGPLWPVIRGLLRKDPDERLDAAQAEQLLRRLASAPAGHLGTRPAALAAASPQAAASPRVDASPRAAALPRVAAGRRRSRGSAAALAGSAAVAVMAVSGGVGFAFINSPLHQTTSTSTPAHPAADPPAASSRPQAITPHLSLPKAAPRTSRQSASHPRPQVPAGHREWHHGHGHDHGDGGEDS